jgi:hypothetical protein
MNHCYGRMCSSEKAREGRGQPAREEGKHSTVQFGLEGTSVKRYEIFISHASEDKEAIAHPLKHALERLGLRVWLDVAVLKVGDSLSDSLNDGLARSSYAVVILSPHYLGKHWPNYELRGLLAKEARGHKVILPVWHNLSRAEVEAFSLPLADKIALLSSEIGVDEMALRIRDVVAPSPTRRAPPHACLAPDLPQKRPTQGRGNGERGKAKKSPKPSRCSQTRSQWPGPMPPLPSADPG